MTAPAVVPPDSGLLYEKRDDIAIVTLNRPDRGNAVNATMAEGLGRIWSDVKADDSVKAVVITGAGDRHFCAGADVRDMAARGRVSSGDGTMDEENHHTARQNQVWKPVIAAVNGTAVGIGLKLIVDCDIIVASRNAIFLDSHVNIGMVGGIENVGLAKRLPLGTALRMTLQGRDFKLTAERAYQLGMVDEITEPGDLLPAAEAIARSIAKNSPRAVALSQQAIWGSLERDYHSALEYGWSLIRLHWSHPDFLEGPRAYAEGRAPVWSTSGQHRLPG
jgi:enoyl-CoA hydratase/carnithine racemase